MADWKTHLYCANRVNETFDLKGKELDQFLFGSLLPDVNMGWVITPEVTLAQDVTHFDEIGQEYFWAPLRFYEKYKADIDSKNPLYLGYLFHLWLDVSIMADFVSRVSMSDMINNYHDVRQWKWKDLDLFIKDYKYELSAEYIDDIINQSKNIEEVQITKGDLLSVVDYINTFEINADYDYFVYTEQELADFYEKICLDFIKWTKNI